MRRCREQINQAIRKKYWMPLEGRHKTGAWDALDASYTESHRTYHTWEQNQDGSPRPDYENVRDSGELFRQYTLLNKSDSDAVHDLIMATANRLQARAEKQYYAGFAGDLDLFLDLDLSSLAAPWEEFVEALARIRSEFSWAPEIVFCTIQLQILEKFAKEDVRLYRRAETSEKWRDAARANLKRCVTELQKRIAELSSV